jgi:uncharacterized coiled-coil protein SlyX
VQEALGRQICPFSWRPFLNPTTTIEAGGFGRPFHGELTMFAVVAVAIALWCMWPIFFILYRPSRAELEHRVTTLEQDNGTHEATIAELRSELSQGDASRRELSDQLGAIVMEAMDLKDKLGVLQRQLVAKQEEVIDLRQQLSVARREVTDLREALSKALFFPTGPAPQRHP